MAMAMASPVYAQRPELAVIVNSSSVDTADVATVRRVFLARQQNWRNGQRAHPVNLPASSELRSVFSQRVLERSARSLANYWNDLYFHGTQPPPVLESERAVILYVQRTPGSIGYVSLPVAQAASEIKIIFVLQ
jgi:ABC-type phosphate transport system substrate-binding protein